MGGNKHLRKGKRLLSIRERAEPFSFCRQLRWDQLLLGEEDAFPSLQHLPEAEELSRGRSGRSGTVLRRARRVNEAGLLRGWKNQEGIWHGN